MTTGAERRKNILDEVERCVCQDRVKSYGDAEDNFTHIAQRWNLYLQHRFQNRPVHLQPYDIAAMMQDIKLARIASSPLHLDNWVDAAGYGVCGAGIIVKLNDEGNTP